MSLRTGALQVGKEPEHFRHSRGVHVSMATLLAGITPAGNCYVASSQWKEFSEKLLSCTVTLYFPKTMKHKG